EHVGVAGVDRLAGGGLVVAGDPCQQHGGLLGRVGQRRVGILWRGDVRDLRRRLEEESLHQLVVVGGNAEQESRTVRTDQLTLRAAGGLAVAGERERSFGAQLIEDGGDLVRWHLVEEDGGEALGGLGL